MIHTAYRNALYRIADWRDDFDEETSGEKSAFARAVIFAPNEEAITTLIGLVDRVKEAESALRSLHIPPYDHPLAVQYRAQKRALHDAIEMK